MKPSDADSAAILKYSPEEDTWTEIDEKMTTPRYGHAVSVVDANEIEPYCL